MEAKQLDISKLGKLPITQHIGTSAMTTTPNGGPKQPMSTPKFAGVSIFTLALMAVGIYLFVTVVMPMLIIIAQVLTIAAVAGLLWVTRKSIIQWFIQIGVRTRKAFIKNYPFVILAEKRAEMVKNKELFILSKANIYKIVNDMQSEATKQEKEAKDLELRLVKYNKEVKELDSVVKAFPDKESETYVDAKIEYDKKLALSSRTMHRYEQCKDYAHKYAAKGAVMNQIYLKLKPVEGYMDIKLEDFDASVDMLQKDYNYAHSMRVATDAASSALGFKQSWEVDFAIDAVTTGIATDIAFTASNLNDINKLASSFSLDDDATFEKLEMLANSIETGKSEVVDTAKYTRNDVKLTREDKAKSGFDIDIF